MKLPHNKGRAEVLKYRIPGYLYAYTGRFAAGTQPVFNSNIQTC